jgi:phage terminase small subunit
MRGRKPKPAALKIEAGNPGHRRLDADGSVALSPDPPDDLCAIAREKWTEMIRPEIWGAMLKAPDRDLLSEYCRLHARKTRGEAHLAEHGELVAAPNGFPVANPWLALVNKCRHAQNFFSPNSSEIKGTEPKSRSRLENRA